MSFKPVDVEEFCHLCDKLIAIATFKSPHQKRNKALLLCDWCSQDDGSRWKRPSSDELIIAHLAVQDGNANKRQIEINAKYGISEVSPDRVRLLTSCNEAKKKIQSGDYRGSTMELLDIVKTIAKI